MRRNELTELIDQLLDGVISEADLRSLEEELTNHAASRRVYYDRQKLHVALQAESEAYLETPSKRGHTPSHDGGRSLLVALVLAASCLFATGLGWWIGRSDIGSGMRSSETTVKAESRQEATSSGVALLTQLVDVQWGEEQPALEVGDALSVGPVAIAAGYAQIDFFCGATLIVEGPAVLDLKSSMLVRVDQGELRALVPHAARGFALEIDGMKVVDLGTEFGVSVSSVGADVQVFDGEVEVYPDQGEKKLLTAGEGIQRTAGGDFAASVVTPERFLDIGQLEQRADGLQLNRYQRWQAWSKEQMRDPRLIAFYNFDQQGGWNRTLRNIAKANETQATDKQATDDERDGAIVGAARVPGRWQNKFGLEFKRPGDRVRVQIPGEFSSLTFACWVKIDSLDRWYNSLFLTDGYNHGEPHWQILDTGQLFFSVRHKPDDASGLAKKKQTHQTVLSPSFWKPSLSGRWLHLATTYDANRGQAKHYLNGEVLHEETIAEDLLVRTTRIGVASLGNWSAPTRDDAEFAIRNLNGSIDEFAIFAAALTAQEIQEMYYNGKP